LAASDQSTVLETVEDLHERIRTPKSATRKKFTLRGDQSPIPSREFWNSHAHQAQTRAQKAEDVGAAASQNGLVFQALCGVRVPKHTEFWTNKSSRPPRANIPRL
jgi:hypothetical protein